VADAPHEHAHRGLPEITRIIEAGGIGAKAKADAIAVFTRLAQAEARIHGVPVEKIHFHEVGALDAILDIVGACVAFEMLGVTGFYTTPFTFGSGTVQTQHGALTVPVPATLALSEGFPSRRTGLLGELCTPTGTAIVTTFAKPLPKDWAGAIAKIGYGAGTRELPGIANVLRLCLMEPSDAAPSAPIVYQVECNLDNMTPELIGYAAERLLAAGCNDVWQESILMKKNRSAVKLCALVEAPRLDAALSLIAAETATGGMRWFPVERLVAEKSAGTVETRFGAVEMKKVLFPGRSHARYSPEFESCRKLAQAAGAPLQEVYREAQLQAGLESPAPGLKGPGGFADEETR
jgi:uncharacterized protein (TIGR00299 family) protein